MTNSVAISLVLLIIAIVAADHFWLHLDLPVLAGKQLNRSIEYLIFWR